MEDVEEDSENDDERQRNKRDDAGCQSSRSGRGAIVAARCDLLLGELVDPSNSVARRRRAGKVLHQILDPMNCAPGDIAAISKRMLSLT